MTANGRAISKDLNNKPHAFPPRIMAPQLRGHSLCIFIGKYKHIMGLILRSTAVPNNGSNAITIKGSALTYAEGDGNFSYLLTNMSGSNINITGSTSVLGNFASIGTVKFPSLSNALNNNLVSYNSASGQLFYSPTGSISVGTASYVTPLRQNVSLTGSLFVTSSGATLGQFVGSQNGYVEFSVRNISTGVSASGDIAVYADNGTTTNNYIDMGINNSGLSNSYFYGGTDFGDANDAYLYNVGGNLRIGNATSQAPYSQSLFIFSNPSATPDITITGSRVGIQKSNNPLNATLDVNGSAIISGSLNNGQYNKIVGLYSHPEGQFTRAEGDFSHTEGYYTTASGNYSHAEGESTKTIGNSSHAEGSYTVTTGDYSHAEGENTLAEGYAAHTEGYLTTASGDFSHAEGNATLANGSWSHAEGSFTVARAQFSHAEGFQTTASGVYSHAEGWNTVTSGSFQLAIGQYNQSSSFQSAFIIGNGTSNSNRSNLLFASGSSFQISGSLNVTGSNTLVGTKIITGSVFISGSKIIIGNNTVTGSMLTTGSIILVGNQTITGSLTVSGSSTLTNIGPAVFSGSVTLVSGATGSLLGTSSFATTSSYAANADLLDGKDSTVFATTGSNTFIGNQTVTGSLFTSGSNTLIGSTTLTGSFNLTGSSTLIGNQVVTGSLFTSGSQTLVGTTTLSGSILVSGSQTFNGTSAFYGNHTLSGSNTIIGNTILSGSIEVSGSTNFRNNVFIVTGSASFKGTHTVSGSTSVTGSFDVVNGNINIVSGSSFTRWGNKLFNYGGFSSTETQSGSANVSQSFTYNTTDTSNGVTFTSGSRIVLENIGIYNLQFSAQVVDTGAGNSTIHIWLKKNGSNVANTTTRVFLTANQETVTAWNWIVQATAPNDYYQIAWQTDDADTRILAATATGNFPAIPSVITTVIQIA